MILSSSVKNFKRKKKKNFIFSTNSKVSPLVPDGKVHNLPNVYKKLIYQTFIWKFYIEVTLIEVNISVKDIYF